MINSYYIHNAARVGKKTFNFVMFSIGVRETNKAGFVCRGRVCLGGPVALTHRSGSIEAAGPFTSSP